MSFRSSKARAGIQHRELLGLLFLYKEGIIGVVSSIWDIQEKLSCQFRDPSVSVILESSIFNQTGRMLSGVEALRLEGVLPNSMADK
jgi:hypothetical protein